MGEDLLYLKYLQEVEKNLNTDRLGKGVVGLLNHWRMRLSSDIVSDEINRWYKGDTIKRIEEIPYSLLELDFSDP